MEEIPEEAGSESVDGIPPAQEDTDVPEETYDEAEETLNEDEILTPFDPSEEENGEAGSESVDGIPRHRKTEKKAFRKRMNRKILPVQRNRSSVWK